jgi:hypothetical protein
MQKYGPAINFGVPLPSCMRAYALAVFNIPASTWDQHSAK